MGRMRFVIDFIPPWNFVEKILTALPALISAGIAYLAFQWNRNREQHHFRVCCQCLHREVASHRDWIELILNEKPLSKEIVSTQPITKDFDHLKYDDAFRYMPVEDFRAIFAYYQKIEMQQFLIQKLPGSPLSQFVKESDLRILLRYQCRILETLDSYIKKRSK